MLLGERVLLGILHRPEDFNLISFLEEQFHGLLATRGLNEVTSASDRRPCGAVCLGTREAIGAGVDDCLQPRAAGAVVDLDEEELAFVGLARRLHPTADRHPPSHQGLAAVLVVEQPPNLRPTAHAAAVVGHQRRVRGRCSRTGGGSGGRRRREGAAGEDGREGLLRSARAQPALGGAGQLGNALCLVVVQGAGERDVSEGQALTHEVRPAVEVLLQDGQGLLHPRRLRAAQLHVGPVQPGVDLRLLDEGATVDLRVLVEAADAPEDGIGVPDHTDAHVKLGYTRLCSTRYKLQIDISSSCSNQNLLRADVFQVGDKPRRCVATHAGYCQA
mmetsp:Transcript_107701/g.286693  ORF Transcript_107701/g.286693 Transcript_107701/m.286693 type:complete len:331 (+) Transcript_107701:1162-2154(+)